MGLLDRFFGSNENNGADDSPEFRQLVEKATNHLQTLTAAHDGLWHISKADWSADLDSGVLAFDAPNGTHVEAPLQVIGTYNTEKRTWLWGWDHPSVEPPFDAHAQQMREYGAKHGLADLTTRTLHCSSDRCWEFTAVACLLNAAQGAYRGPSGSTFVFMTFGEVKLSPAES